MDSNPNQNTSAIQKVIAEIENHLLPESDLLFMRQPSYRSFRAYFKARIACLKREVAVIEGAQTSHLHTQRRVKATNTSLEQPRRTDENERSEK